MDALIKAALERLDAATMGRPMSGYSSVQSEDVVAVAATLDKPDGVCAALLKGATGAGLSVEIYQRTDHLRHLIECANK
jgi:hypothetical protein